MTARIVVAEDVWGAAFDRLAEAWHVRRIDGTAQPSELADARALVVRNRTKVDRDLLESAPELRVVARAGVGLDNIDVAAADDLGVVVVAPLGANAVSVAEHTVGLALAVARRTVELDSAVRRGAWTRAPGRELSGGVWGLLSAGATARATGRLARALGMTVRAHDPYCDPHDPELAEIGIELCALDEVVRTADVLSVHLPATAETDRLVDAQLLARAKPGVILVNVGRGEVVDEPALAAAVQQGHVAGAGLDVRQSEPPEPGPLDDLPTVVFTPHVAGITAQSQARIAEVLCTGIEDVLAGRPTASAVTHASVSPKGRA